MKKQYCRISLVLLFILTTHELFSWRPPMGLLLTIATVSRRDKYIAGAAALCTFLIMRTYYAGQEERIKNTIQEEADKSRKSQAELVKKLRAQLNTMEASLKKTVDATHKDVLTNQQQGIKLLTQNEALAEILLRIHRDQQRLLANQNYLGGLIEGSSHSNAASSSSHLLEDAKPTDHHHSFLFGGKHYPVDLTALAIKISPQPITERPPLITTLPPYQITSSPSYQPSTNVEAHSFDDTSYLKRFLRRFW